VAAEVDRAGVAAQQDPAVVDFGAQDTVQAGHYSPIMARTIASNTAVGRDELLAFLRDRHHMILLTWRRDGGVQGSPVTAGVDGEGRIVVATYPERAKSGNVARQGKASVIVLSEEFNGAWVQVDGDAELITLPDALEPLVDYFRSISGEHSDWAEYRSAMTEQGKALIRITPTRWGPIATGGFPARLG
jgi:PPOX class probable F420-dependent enzyme